MTSQFEYLPVDLEVRRVIFDTFVEKSAPPSVEEAADALNLSSSVVRDSFSRLDHLHAIVLRLDSHEVEIALPFSALPTSHVVRADSHSWFANCAWDSLGILAAINSDGDVETTCPDCGDRFELRLRSGVVEGSCHMHFVVRGTGGTTFGIRDERSTSSGRKITWTPGVRRRVSLAGQ